MKLDNLLKMSVEGLANQIFNDTAQDLSSFEKDEEDKRGFGKRIPYIGWFYRSSDFIGKRISIGKCENFIGVMENNKWDYPERYMTENEVNIYIDFLEKATETYVAEERDNICDDMWNWFQILDIKGKVNE